MSWFFGSVGGVITFILSVALYFLPTIIALVRKHYNKVGVILLNVFLGWTFIGWIAALIWSFSKR